MTSINIYSSTIEIKKTATDFLFSTISENVVYFESLKKTNLYNFINKTEEETDKLEFSLNCKEVNKLSKYIEKKHNRLQYNESFNLLQNVGNQLLYIEKNNITKPYLDIDDIVVCEECGEDSETLFILLNFEETITIIKPHNIIIDKPYRKTKYFSPELLKINTLPDKIHKNSWIFSLGSLVVNCLNNEETTRLEILLSNIDNKREFVESYLNKINSIERTKLYHSLLRCLKYEPENRKFLII
jgi:hypothetical protein